MVQDRESSLRVDDGRAIGGVRTASTSEPLSERIA